jgi:hypothetical protein
MQRESSNSVRIFYPEFSKEELIQTIARKLETLSANLPVVKIVIFGSYAKGNYTARSDIDLLVIYRGKPQREAYAITKKILDIPRLEPHLYTEEEYKNMKDTIDKMSQGGIVLLFRRGAEGNTRQKVLRDAR